MSKLSRRKFLAISGGSTAAFLAACAPAVSPVVEKAAEAVPTAAPQPTAPQPTVPPTMVPAVAEKAPVTIRFAGLESMGTAAQKRTKEWCDENKITLELGAFGQQEITDKVMQSVATSTYLADIVQFESNTRADVIGNNALMEVPADVQAKINLSNVLPGIMKTLSWNGKIYALPYDGDIHYQYFRKDLFANADINKKFKAKYGYDLSAENGAETWQQWQDIGAFFTGWDWNEDGKTDTDYGLASMDKRGDTLWWGFNSRATAYGKHPDDPGFILDTKTGEARVNNPAFVRALTEWKAENEKYSPPGGMAFGYGDTLDSHIGGRVVQTYGWDGVTAATSEKSLIAGKQGFNILPGSNEVYNSGTGKWDKFEKASHAPFLAFGGWVLAVMANAEPETLQATWEWLSYMCGEEKGMEMVTTATGCSPYRSTQLSNVAEFANGPLKLGEEAAKDYLDAASSTLNHPNAVVDFAMPGWVQYRDAMELGVSRGMAGETDPQSAMDEVKAAFDEISVRMGGLEKQAEIYRLVLGV